MPSSGKTTLAKRLARALHYQFTDTDRLLVRTEKRTIAEIFAQDGEAYFRAAEARILRTILPGSNLVVATGGGLPCFHQNMAYINETGISVFVDVGPAELANRMHLHAQQYPAPVAERPLFDEKDPALLETLTQKRTERLPTYLQANIVLSGEGITEDDILDRLGDWL